MVALNQLAHAYKERYQWSDEADIRHGLDEVAKSYIKRNAIAIADGISLAVALEALLGQQEVQLDQLSDQAREAFNEAFPNVAIESLHDASPQQLEGMLNTWKGKLFEVDVRDRLNQGEWVGDWHLEPGQTATLAEGANQAGWDLSILDDDGTVAEVIQLKATDSASYIQAALERYPDIHILATSDVSAIDHLESVSTDAISVHDYSSQITAAVPVDSGHNLVDGIGMMAPAWLIALTEGYKVITGKKSMDAALDSGGERLAMAGIAATAGVVVTAITGGFLGIMAAVGARLYLESKFGGPPTSQSSSEFKLEDGITIEGEATLVNKNKPDPKNKSSKPKPRVDSFKKLESLNNYLGQKYLPG